MRKSPTSDSAEQALTCRAPLAYPSRNLTDREEEIAHLRETVERLEESEALYRTLVMSSPEAIVIADLNLSVISANREASMLFAGSAVELAGRSIMSLLFPGGIAPAQDFWRKLLTTGVAREWESRLSRLDGSRFTADVSVSLSPDIGTGARFLVAIVRDVTPRRQSELAARETLKMEALERFAGGVAHEFNNLLAAIRGHCELLLKKHPEDDPTSGKIRQIVKSVDRAIALVRQLLTFSRRQKVAPQVFDVNRALARLEVTLCNILGPNVDLSFELDPAAAYILIDPGEFDRMLMNLIANSRDAMREPGTVTVASRLAPPWVVISVTDTGIGIPESVQSRIFEPFFTTKEVGQGVGLGLAAVYGTVDQAEGKVTVESTAGQGATVAIYLPSHEAAVCKP